MTSRHARVTWHAAKMADRTVPAYFSYFFPGLFTPFSHPTVFPSRAGKFYHSYLFPQESVIRTRLLAFQLWRVLKCRFFHDVSCFDFFFVFCALSLCFSFALLCPGFRSFRHTTSYLTTLCVFRLLVFFDLFRSFHCQFPVIFLLHFIPIFFIMKVARNHNVS